MAFVQFTEEVGIRGAVAEPRVAVTNKDELRFNAKAISTCNLGQITHFTVWWDDDSETIGLQPCLE